MNPRFQAKVLLFGEYLILEGAEALSRPVNTYSGGLTFDREDASINYIQESAVRLQEFVGYLNLKKKLFHFEIHFEQLMADLRNGIWFDSNIPLGSGLGSSGALCSAFFDRYQLNREEVTVFFLEKHINEIRNDLRLMENFYHGNSSGIDPLTSYLGMPIHIKGDLIRMIPLKNQIDKEFLIDTRITSTTGNLVALFNQRIKEEPSFQRAMIEKLIPLNNQLITNYLKGNSLEFISLIEEFSNLQFHYFKSLFPKKYHPLIRESWENHIFTLKLCGSGGGGYLLGFTSNLKETSQFLANRGEMMVPI